MNLSAAIQQIDALKKDADALQPVNPDFEQKFWWKFRLDFNYNSNHLEGNTLTYGHTQLLLMFDKVGSDSYSLRELEEMKAHDAALKLVKEAALDPNHVLTEKFIKEINQIILVRPYYKEAETYDGQPTRRLIEPGQYKKFPNNVRLENGEVFHYASVEETPAQMGDLIDWIRKEEESKELHPVQLAALVHYRFVSIHPFDDSNGRTSRLLMNYYLMRYGYTPVVIESSDKRNYLAALNRADTGDIDAFINYISNQALLWQQLFNTAIKGINIEGEDDYKKEIELLKKDLKTRKNRIETELNNEIFGKIISSSITNLLLQFVKELSAFDELFLKNDFEINYRSINTWGDTPDEESVKDFLSSIIKIGLKGVPSIFEITYSHYNLRKHDAIDFNYQNNFLIIFDRFDYSIINNVNGKNFTLIKKPYHENLSEDEINSFCKSFARVELAVIKEKSN